MNRIKGLQIFFIAVFILLSGCLFYLQILKGPAYKELSSRNSIRLLGINAPRGIIYDRNNKILAHNALSFGVFMVQQEAENIDDEIRKLSKILDIPEALLKRNYKRNYEAPFAPCELIRDIPKQKAILVEELKLDMPGVLVREIPLRSYPYKEAFAHVVGYIGEIDRQELELLKSYGYNVRDLIGKDGVERTADGILRGKDGGMQIQVNNRGRQVKVLGSREPQRGKDVYLTLDARLQSFLWKMMEDTNGAAVFMDVHTGGILSIVSAPSYDPNRSVAEVLNNKDAPLLNRAITGQYPPGSVFKLIVALAGLETGKIHSDTNFTCRGKLAIGNSEFNCWQRDGHGPMALKDAVIESCNNYFYNTGMMLGMERILEYAHKFGLGRKTGIELFAESGGFMPSRAWKMMEKKERWYAGDTVNLSIGQGYLLATPLQLAAVVGAIANGGELVEPHIVRKIGDIDVNTHKSIKLKIREENIDIVRRAMRGVVESEGGTGVNARSSIVSISAKTGTSQAGPGLQTHAWFAGFAPSENPRISFVVFLEHGGSGGDAAAIIAKNAVEYWWKNR